MPRHGAARAIGRTKTALSLYRPIKRVAFDGDSEGTPTNPNTPPEKWRTDNPTIASANYHVSGSSIGYPTSTDTTAFLWARIDQLVAFGADTVVLWAGQNDLQANNQDGSTGTWSDWLGRAQGFVAGVRARYAAAGLPNPRILWGTLLPRGAGAGTAPAVASYNADRKLANAALRAAVGVWLEGIAPYGDHPLLDDAAANDSGVFDGSQHPQGAGFDIVYQVLSDVLNPMRDGKSGLDPASFSFTAQNNVAVSTAFTDRARITDMGVGRSVVASVSGVGDFARGQNAFGTSPTPLMNGDVATIRETSSSSDDTPVATTLTAGSRSATFTVRTAVADPASFTSSADNRSDDAGGFGSTAQSFANVTFPDGRPIIFMEKYPNNATAVKINGVSATLVVSSSYFGGGFSLWAGGTDLSPQILTAGDYSVSVEGPAQSFVSVYPGAVANSTTRGDTSSLAYANRPDSTYDSNPTYGPHAGAAVTMPSGAVGVMAYFRVAAAAAPTANTGTYPNTLERTYAAVANPVAGDSKIVQFLTFTYSGAPGIYSNDFGNDGLLAGVFTP